MIHRYTVDLSTSGINKLIGVFGGYKKWLDEKSEELARRLAEIGAQRAEINFAASYYDGDFEYIKPTVEKRGHLSYVVRAEGKTVLFIEFGTGLIGDGHPEPNGYGPGTYPGKGHWNQPSGWWYTAPGGGSEHTHGNPPNMPMYNAVREVEMEIDRIVKEVFS